MRVPFMGGGPSAAPVLAEVVDLPRAGPHAVVEGDIILGAVTTDLERGVDAVAVGGLMGSHQVFDTAEGGRGGTAGMSDAKSFRRRLDIQQGFDA